MTAVSGDTYNLGRYIRAQKKDFEIAYKEVSNGKKLSHWMWYIFPQIIGLGRTGISVEYAIKSLDEAKAYMENPYLRENIIKICEALLSLSTKDPYQVLGSPDDMKLRSSMTLFSLAVPKEEIFQKVLDKYYYGKPDERTIEILRGMGL